MKESEMEREAYYWKEEERNSSMEKPCKDIRQKKWHDNKKNQRNTNIRDLWNQP